MVRGVCMIACVVDVSLIAWLLYTMNVLLIAGNAVLLVIAVLAAYLRGASLPQSDGTRPRGNVGTTDARIR